MICSKTLAGCRRKVWVSSERDEVAEYGRRTPYHQERIMTYEGLKTVMHMRDTYDLEIYLEPGEAVALKCQDIW